MKLFIFMTVFACVYPTSIEIRIDDQLHKITANSIEQASIEARSMISSHDIYGGDCNLLPTRERVNRCLESIISHELIKEIIKESILYWKQTNTTQGMQWDPILFFTGKTYSRKVEMLFREVANLSNFSKDAISLLEHLLDILPTAYSLVKLTLAELTYQSSSSSNTQPSSGGLCAVTVATEMKPSLELLNFTLSSRLDIPFAVLGLGKQWMGHGMKIQLLFQHLTRNTEHVNEYICPVILFLDAYDTLILETTTFHTLLSRFSQFNKKIVFNGETVSSPDRHLADSFMSTKLVPPFLTNTDLILDSISTFQKGKMPFLNSGAFIGEYTTVVRMLEDVSYDLLTHFGIDLDKDEEIASSVDDQRLYSRWYLNHRHLAQVDAGGNIFHTLHNFKVEDFIILPQTDPPILLSKPTWTVPLIIHGNGNGCEVLVRLMDALNSFEGNGVEVIGNIEDRIKICAWPFNTF